MFPEKQIIKQHKKQTKKNLFKKQISILFSFFINKIIYLPNSHVVDYVNFEQQEKPAYEHIDIHQVLELYQAN